MNSIEKYLKELPKGYKEKALRAYKDAPLNSLANVLNTRTAILHGFNWGKTVEGDEYWDKVYEIIRDGKELPTLEEGKQLQNIEQ